VYVPVTEQANNVVPVNMTIVGLEMKQQPQFEARIRRYRGDGIGFPRSFRCFPSSACAACSALT
jgi:hypothetical protein